jgi:hypothetical protein
MLFENHHRLGEDSCYLESQNAQSDKIMSYKLFNPYKTNVENCESKIYDLQNFVIENPNLHIKEGFGFTNACLVDQDSMLRNKAEMTNFKCKSQLATRVFPGGPHLNKSGFESVLDSRLTQGELNASKRKACELYNEKGFDVFTPLIPCLQNTIQDVNHIVPNWTRGGDHTRMDLKESNCHKNNPA